MLNTVPFYGKMIHTFLVVFVGRGTITIIGGREGKTQTFNVQYGDVMRIPEGTPMNVINRDENDKLRIVSLVKPANIPGEYEVCSSIT